MATRQNRGAVPAWLGTAIRIGAIGGVVAVSIALQGMVTAFGSRYVIGNTLSMGHTLLLITFFAAGYFALRQARGPVQALVAGGVAGVLSALFLVLLIAIGTHSAMGVMFVNATDSLYDLLTFGQGLVAGSAVLVGVGLVFGLVAALVSLIPSMLRRSLLMGVGWMVTLGLLQDLIVTTLSNFKALDPLVRFLYTSNGLSIVGTVTIVLVIGILYYVLPLARMRVRSQVGRVSANTSPTMRFVPLALAIIILLALPSLVGLYLTQVLNDVGLYVLLGLGLNIVVGFAGLLDLGYVAFFAIGAYTVGVLTTPDFNHPELLSFWAAVPFAVLAALAAGVILGIPVLNMRGDYLAIVTLGFGEIIRLLALSDFLKPLIGGAQGILDIAKPVVVWFSSLAAPFNLSPVSLIHPEQFYYLILAGCLLIAFVAGRLKNSRLGRAWMAIREDEDAAELMGINLVTTKLLAFGLGASFGGLSGALFASQLGSIFPASFNFIVSVNILSLIIIGGMGNIPGVILGALALVGLPELLREFSDYRFLFYGAALVLMMLTRPEGLLPEARRREELEEFKQEEAETDKVLAAQPQ